MTTPILNISEVANGQVDQYLTVNEALRALERAGNDFVVINLAAGNASITNEAPDFVFDRNVLFRSSGNSVVRDLDVPQAKRLFLVNNGGSAALSVVRGTTSISVTPGGTTLFYSDGTENGLTAVAGGGGSASSLVVSVSSASGILDLSAVDDETIKVLLTEDISTVLLPAGVAGERRDLIIRFEQDGTGGWAVDLSAIAWDGDGIAPAVSGDPGDITYVTATNIDNEGWEGFK